VITIDIKNPARGEPKVFSDEAAAIVWLQDEILRWENVLSRLVKDQSSPCATPLRQWREIKTNLDNVRRRRLNTSEEINYVERDEQNRIVLIDSIYGRSLIFVIDNLGAQAGDFAAIHAGLADGEMNWSDDATFRGAILFDRIKDLESEYREQEHEQNSRARRTTAEKHTESIMQSITKLDGMISSLASATVQQREQMEAELKTYKAEAVESWRKVSGQAKSIETANKSSIESAEIKINNAIKEAQSAVDSWTEAHNEQRQLEKPAALWAERAITHSNNSDRWRSWSIGVGICGLVLAVLIAVYTFQWSRPLFAAAIIPGTAASAQASAGTLRPTFHYELIFTGAITLAWLTMYLWAMRLLVRLYTTEQHLAIDASARGAMMEAYLGLIKADAASATDRPIVLQALFRPVQDGMVRDDGPPGITPAALLSALATSNGKGS
jgi:hypothetical protein